MTSGASPVDPASYRYSVSWSDEDGEYVATCDGLPSLSWLAPNAEEALACLRRVVADVVADTANDGAG